jgi:hypothetical protein
MDYADVECVLPVRMRRKKYVKVGSLEKLSYFMLLVVRGYIVYNYSHLLIYTILLSPHCFLIIFRRIYNAITIKFSFLFNYINILFIIYKHLTINNQFSWVLNIFYPVSLNIQLMIQKFHSNSFRDKLHNV